MGEGSCVEPLSELGAVGGESELTCCPPSPQPGQSYEVTGTCGTFRANNAHLIIPACVKSCVFHNSLLVTCPLKKEQMLL